MLVDFAGQIEGGACLAELGGSKTDSAFACCGYDARFAKRNPKAVDHQGPLVALAITPGIRS
jgi:hypothetical protein